MNIRGTAFNPGFEAPKIEKIYCWSSGLLGFWEVETYTENDDEQKINVGHVVELEIQVLRHEAYWRVFGGTNLVPGIHVDVVAILVLFRVR